MSKKGDQYGKTTANFRIDPKEWEAFSNIAFEQYGFGGISIVLSTLVKEFIQKFDGKTAKLDSFLDPNFTPKPSAYDDIEKNVMPYAQNLNDSDLHQFRIWLYQGYNVCMAFSKMPPNQRKNCKMSYDQLFDLVYKDDR